MYLRMTMLLVIERVEFPDFFRGKYSGIRLAWKQSGYHPHRKCVVYSEAECQANAPQGTRRSPKKISIPWESAITSE